VKKELGVILLLALPVAAEEQLLTSFEDSPPTQLYQCYSWYAERGASHGQKALQVRFGVAEWPSVRLRPDLQNWRGYGGLAIDLYNPNTTSLEFMVRVDDDEEADGQLHSRLAQGRLAAGEHGSFFMNLSRDPLQFGMRALPLSRGLSPLDLLGFGEFHQEHVVGYQVQLRQAFQPTELTVDRVRLTDSLPLKGLVDCFGQNSREDWPEKVRDEAQLRQRSQALPPRSRVGFGGWRKGPRFAPGGFFTTRLYQGRWWLQDPEGYLFFSLGVNYVKIDSPTVVSDREEMFGWLPTPSGPLGDCYRPARCLKGPVPRALTFDFYRANLQRKFGRDYEPQWREQVLRRLPAWGFNTLANWSASQLYRNGRLPYTVNVRYASVYRQIPGPDDYWGALPDPFDPVFEKSLRSGMRQLRWLRDDPFLLGYFVDNELSWGDERLLQAPRAVLALSVKDSPAKLELVALLRQRYSLPEFNHAWGLHLPDWQALEAPLHLSNSLSEACRADLSDFLDRLADRYFEVVAGCVHEQDPHHLYLGCRLGWSNPVVLRAAHRHCDVISVNHYQASLSEFCPLPGKPYLISEFHVGTRDRGLFHAGLVQAPHQLARARIFTSFMNEALSRPEVVGCHWFDYVDQPLLGRSWDGENSGIGLVDITDTPYAELVAASREVGRRLYLRKGDTGLKTRE